MTAEITIMNRQAIALAADSALTVGRQRVWKTANKLFSLAPYNDIAIMAYGAGDFAGIPWETVIKIFRSQVGKKKFSTVSDCASQFVEYLSNFSIVEESEERAGVLVLFIKLFEVMKKSIGNSESVADFKEKLAARIKFELDAIAKRDTANANISRQDFISGYKDLIEGLAKDIFKSHITKKILNELVDLCFRALSSQMRSDYYTGIVIAGFGESEVFPAQEVYIIDGKHKSLLRHWKGKNCRNLNEKGSTSACITPLGQSDIAVLFLEGIAKQHLQWMRRTLKLILDNKSDSLISNFVKDDNEKIVESTLQRKENTKAVRELEKEFQSYRNKSLVQPVMDVLANLPKEEMADMAEALVELTSLRRRVDSPLESVGGPIDVAVISKGDGLVWIKRKHYFDGGLNADFRQRKRLQFED